MGAILPMYGITQIYIHLHSLSLGLLQDVPQAQTNLFCQCNFLKNIMRERERDLCKYVCHQIIAKLLHVYGHM